MLRFWDGYEPTTDKAPLDPVRNHHPPYGYSNSLPEGWHRLELVVHLDGIQEDLPSGVSLAVARVSEEQPAFELLADPEDEPGQAWLSLLATSGWMTQVNGQTFEVHETKPVPVPTKGPVSIAVDWRAASDEEPGGCRLWVDGTLVDERKLANFGHRLCDLSTGLPRATTEGKQVRARLRSYFTTPGKKLGG